METHGMFVTSRVLHEDREWDVDIITVEAGDELWDFLPEPYRSAFHEGDTPTDAMLVAARNHNEEAIKDAIVEDCRAAWAV